MTIIKKGEISMDFDEIIDRRTGKFKSDDLEKMFREVRIPKCPKEQDDFVLLGSNVDGARLFKNKDGKIIRR